MYIVKFVSMLHVFRVEFCLPCYQTNLPDLCLIPQWCVALPQVCISLDGATTEQVCVHTCGTFLLWVSSLLAPLPPFLPRPLSPRSCQAFIGRRTARQETSSRRSSDGHDVHCPCHAWDGASCDYVWNGPARDAPTW